MEVLAVRRTGAQLCHRGEEVVRWMAPEGQGLQTKNAQRHNEEVE